MRRCVIVAVVVAVGVVVALGSCARREPAVQLDLDRIDVGEPIRRTDTVGEGRFTETATFVLVDATNTADRGADVTLGGELVDASGAALGSLAPQSLWIPAGESRTFALVDGERKPRPGAAAVTIKVRGATVPKQPPTAWIEDLHTFDDHGKIVAQAHLVHGADRPGQILVIGAFHDAANRPMTRPFRVVRIGPTSMGSAAGDCPDLELDQRSTSSRCVVQFVGPEGSKRGTIFVGGASY